MNELVTLLTFWYWTSWKFPTLMIPIFHFQEPIGNAVQQTFLSHDLLNYQYFKFLRLSLTRIIVFLPLFAFHSHRLTLVMTLIFSPTYLSSFLSLCGFPFSGVFNYFLAQMLFTIFASLSPEVRQFSKSHSYPCN